MPIFLVCEDLSVECQRMFSGFSLGRSLRWSDVGWLNGRA